MRVLGVLVWGGSYFVKFTARPAEVGELPTISHIDLVPLREVFSLDESFKEWDDRTLSAIEGFLDGYNAYTGEYLVGGKNYDAPSMTICGKSSPESDDQAWVSPTELVKRLVVHNADIKIEWVLSKKKN